ncbi:MAG: hypothetical protein KJ607_01860, partial [Bacteroidetes bacterium]|nr:hypothetical protein [Bacteroidota bacterium]
MLVSLRFLLVFLAFAVFLPVIVKAQTKGLDPEKRLSQYKICFFSKEEGLPMRNAISILQTGDGYIWFATYNGLVRFDGQQMSVFNSSTDTSLRKSGYWCLFEDYDSSLWAGALGGLIHYINDKWIFYGEEQGIHASMTTGVCRDKNKRLWIGTTQGLHYLENDSILDK